MIRFASSVLLLTAALFSSLANAADLATPKLTKPPLIASSPLAGWEFRAGVLAHNPFFRRESGTVDGNLEVLTPKLYQTGDPLLQLLIPRAQAGVTVNFGRYTTLGYGGFAWDYPVTDKIFLEATVGVAGHNGLTRDIGDNRRTVLGCNPLIYSSGSAGYRLTEHWSVMATLQHVSNGGICGRNQGLTHVGGRIGYTF